MNEREMEIAQKSERIHNLLGKIGLEGICLSKAINFAWFTAGGNNRVVTSMDTGAAAIVIINDRKYLVAPKNEIERFMEEQVPDMGFEPWTYEWYDSREQAINNLVGDKKIGTDIPMGDWQVLGAELNRLRYSLTIEEIKRAQELAEICSRELAATCVSIVPGQTEFEIQAELSRRLMYYGVRPAVLLVSADERTKYRHPVPTRNQLHKYAIIGVVGEKGGLHMALTRSIYFGTLPAIVKHYYEVGLLVHKTLIKHSEIGANSQAIFDEGCKAYDSAGCPDEWKRHHQGGAIGYAPREYRAGEGKSELIVPNQMLAWNPTVEVTKSEDTFLLTSENTMKLLTTVPKWWPTLSIVDRNSQINFPLILER
ncbi:MAG TPA: M24 family metallopeptidase [Desulfosporosinus sp.]|nr:M24 family metallopeptidase [Desulfosporosinus sp.]